MFCLPFLGSVALLELARGAFGANTDSALTCNTQADCPKCSKCEPASYWWRVHMGNWGTCVYDDSNNSACPRDRCNMGFCTDINQCATQPHADQTSIKCGQTKWCKNGFCGESSFQRNQTELDNMNVSGKLNIRGFQGQQVDWKGEDGGWYVLISDTADVQLSVRLTAPLARDFPDRQLITAFALKYHGGHSIIIETKFPHTSQAEGCLDAWYVPCLADNSLRITIDGEVHDGVPVERASLPGNVRFTATNLPFQCQPRGDGHISAYQLTQISTDHSSMITAKQKQQQKQQQQQQQHTFVDAETFGARPHQESFSAWVSSWSTSTVAPTWCAKYFEGVGAEGTLKYKGRHAVFRIETPALTVRLHHGTTNWQGRGTRENSGFEPDDLEFWKMDVHLERYNLNSDVVVGMLGETMRPVLDGSGKVVMFGPGALRGEIENYRVSGPLCGDFEYFHE